MVALGESVTVFGIEIPVKYLLVGALVALALLCGCSYKAFCKTKKIVAGERFKWPSSSSYLKKTDPGKPQKMVIDKYDDPMRTDDLPEGSESHWAVVYQPNGERPEVKQHMYLHFKDGIVFGVGIEKIRKLCKISGKYERNRVSNQTVLAFTCKFSNELDTVLFHGCGNGTGFVGNCYIHEIDRFSSLSNVWGLRNMTGHKFKASFLLVKMASMGDPHLRARLHTKRVHQWAGSLFPDVSVPRPMSPITPTGVTASRESYFSVEDMSNSISSTTRSTHSNRSRSRFLPKAIRRNSANPTNSGGKRKGFSKYFPFSRRSRGVHRQHSFEDSSPTSTAGGYHSGADEYPPWVQKGAGSDDEDGRYLNTVNRGRMELSPSVRSLARSPNPPMDSMNYLEVDGIPGRNGPAMV